MEIDLSLEETAPIGTQLISSLRRRIVSGELVPGTRLSEKDIATAYDLSRQPVREAFIKLAGDRLVEIRPQRGTFVCKINVEEVIVSRFVREAVEADLARTAAQLTEQTAVDTLLSIVDEQEARLAEGGAVFMELDEKFHRCLAEAAGKSDAWFHLQPIKMHMDRVRHLTAVELPVDPLVAQHREIAQAIAHGKSDIAERAMRLHLKGVLDHLQEMQQALPGYFT